MVFFEGYTDGIKQVIFFYASVPSVNLSVILFFLLTTDLPTDKKLPMKDSPTEYFRL
jgi:hypothetical protein